MSEAQEIISVINSVVGEVDLPICLLIIDSQGLELYSSKNCSEESLDTNIFGIMAFESINEQIAARSKKNVDLLIFKVEDQNFLIAPVAEDLFLVANTDFTRLGHVLPLLEGMRSQMSFKIQLLRNK